MATKTAQIVIDVDDKSLQELNSEIKQLETSISKLKTNTQEWNKQNQKLGQLKTQLNNATKEATKLQNVVEKVSGAEQLRAFAKLGTGIVGTFAAVNGSVSLLGKNSEVFEEITAKAASFLQIMGGLNAISETFSKENLKGLQAIGGGFKSLVGVVKGASAGMKAALISTGIGALVVGVGLLIANFDKLKNLLNRQDKRDKEAAEERLKNAQLATTVAEGIVKIGESQLELAKEENKYTNETYKIKQAEATLINAQIAANERLQNENAAAVESNKLAYANAKKADEDGIKAEAVKLRMQGDLLKEQKRILDYKFAESVETLKVAKAVDRLNSELKANEVRQINIGKLLYKQREEYLAQREALSIQANIIYQNRDANQELTAEAISQLNALQAQIKVLDVQEKQREKVLKLEIEQLKYERDIANQLYNMNVSYKLNTEAKQEELNATLLANDALDDSVKSAEKLAKKYEDFKKVKAEIANFDERGKKIMQEQNDALFTEIEAEGELIDANQEKLRGLLEGKKAEEDLINILAIDLALQEKINNAKIEKLEKDKESKKISIELLQQQQEFINKTLALLSLQKSYLQAQLDTAKAQADNAKTGEERKAALEKVVELEGQVNDLNLDILDKQSEIAANNNEIAQTNQEIINSDQQINDIVTDTEQKTKETADNIEKQSLTYAQLQSLVKKYGEEINVVWQNLMAGFSLVAAIYDRKAANAQENIDELNEQLDDIAEAEAEHQDKLLGYQEELKDANGERYDELMAAIELESQAKDDLKAQEDAINADLEKEEKKKLAAEAKAAKWRKAQALIDATIAGALAVIKSLPNIFLSIGVGILSGLQIGIIAAQKTEPIPEGYAEGGYTGDGGKYEPAGIVHKGEYVVPAHLVSKNAPIINSIEEQRLRGYADGGLVTPALGNAGQDMINYDRMAQAFYSAILSMPNPVVSVQKITNAQREVAVTKSNAGL